MLLKMDYDDKYKDFFEQIKKFKNEQAKQKQRGLNDYNILTAVRKPHAEVGMHSNFIYSLINPDGLHYQDDLFVNLFIKYVLKIDDFGKVIKVEIEEDANGRRIDFTIKSDKYYIGIEMKIYAYDQNNQIKDYFTSLTNKAKQNNQKVIIYYLTIDGKEASKNSYQDIAYKQISFETEILDWLKKCQKEVKNITNLNIAIEQYKDVVKMVIGDYKSPINNFKDFFLNNKEFYKLYSNSDVKEKISDKKIDEGFNQAKQKLYDDYYKHLFEPLLKLNTNLSYFGFDNSTQNIFVSFAYKQYYEICIYLNSDSYRKKISIGIRPAWNILHWQGNKDLKNRLENLGNYIPKNYIINKNKGLKIDYSLEQPTIEEIFKLPIKLDNNNIIIKELQNCIKEIENGSI